MLDTTCLSNVLCIRFDFGVPLEDIFPPDDIHPRLKYLFGKAYKAYELYKPNIESILLHGQGTTEERLKLKDKLVYELDYSINVDEFSPGAYFWVIRHFLGLLPLPLFPRYTSGIHFDWHGLAKECQIIFEYRSSYEEKNLLDYDIAETLNVLPVENFLLISMLILFIKKISLRKQRGAKRLHRKSLSILCKYFCYALYSRPFRIGCTKNDLHLPLLFYLIIRWDRISKVCKSIGYPPLFSENDLKMANFNRNNILSNAFFNPEVIAICRNIPLVVEKNSAIKNVECQTETDLNINPVDTIFEENEEQIEDICTPINEDPKIASNDAYKLAYIDDDFEEEEINDDTLYKTANDFTFKSGLDNEDWPKISQETSDTIKKVDELYIYDDYETFKKEDFNQVGNKRSKSFLSRISKYSFSYSSPKASARDEAKKSSPESDISYIKYPDVCDDIDLNKNRPVGDIQVNHSISSANKAQSKSVSEKLFADNSPRSEKGEDSKQELQDESQRKRNRKKYVLKRIRLSLEFLRTLTPKKASFKRIGSKVKYHKIKNIKSQTL